MRFDLFLAAVLLLTGSSLRAAPPKVDSFFPPGLQQGQTVKATTTGSISNWPARVYVDREGLTVEPSEKSGEFKITASPDAAGVYWVRVYDDEGAASLRPLVIGGISEVIESETNDDPQKPQPLEGPATVNGKLAKRGDVDSFSIQLQAGQTLVASLLANEVFNSPMDGVLQICNRDGFVLAQNDDARGLDPLLVFTAPRGDTFLVRTFAFPAEPNSSIAFAGDENFAYRLTITTGPFVDSALPSAVRGDASTELRLFGWNLENKSVVIPSLGADRESYSLLAPGAATALELPVVNRPLASATEDNSPESPQTVELPAVVSGMIEGPKDSDAFRFVAKKGQKILLRVNSRSLGFEMDPLLQVLDAAGKMLSEADDAGKDRDPALTFTAPEDGEFRAIVRDLHFHGGLRYAYRLTLEEESPDFHLTLAADAFTLSAGKPLEIPVTIDRLNGFSGEIEISAANLPPDVTAAPVTSLPKGDTAKTVKLTLTCSAGPASGPITIVGQSSGDAPLRRIASFTIPGLKATHSQAWLTATKPD